MTCPNCGRPEATCKHEVIHGRGKLCAKYFTGNADAKLECDQYAARHQGETAAMTHKLNPVAFEAAHKTYLDDGAGYVAVKLANAIEAYLDALEPVAFLRHRKSTSPYLVFGQPGQTEDEVWTGSFPAYDLRRSVYDPAYNAEREASEAGMASEPLELPIWLAGDRVQRLGEPSGPIGVVQSFRIAIDGGYIPQAEIHWEGDGALSFIDFDKLQSAVAKPKPVNLVSPEDRKDYARKWYHIGAGDIGEDFDKQWDRRQDK